MAKSYVSKLTTCPRTMPKRNVHWQAVPMGSVIMDCGNYYVARMATPRQPRARYAVINWSSHDARAAQTYLKDRMAWYKGMR